MTNKLILGITLGILTGVISNVWVTEMYRYIDNQNNLYPFILTTIVFAILIIFLFIIAIYTKKTK